MNINDISNQNISLNLTCWSFNKINLQGADVPHMRSLANIIPKGNGIYTLKGQLLKVI